MNERDKSVLFGIAIVVGIAILAIGLVVVTETNRCEYPLWVELNDPGGGTLLAKTSSMKGIFTDPSTDGMHRTRIILGEGASVVVGETVSELKQLLCAGE